MEQVAFCKYVNADYKIYRDLRSTVYFPVWMHHVTDNYMKGNLLASISRHYCSISYRNSMPKMRITGNVLYLFERTSPCHLLNWYLRRIDFREKIFPGNLLLLIGSRKLQISRKVFCQYISEIYFHWRYFCYLRPKG